MTAIVDDFNLFCRAPCTCDYVNRAIFSPLLSACRRLKQEGAWPRPWNPNKNMDWKRNLDLDPDSPAPGGGGRTQIHSSIRWQPNAACITKHHGALSWQCWPPKCTSIKQSPHPPQTVVEWVPLPDADCGRVDQSSWARSQQVTRSKVRLGCVQMVRACNDFCRLWLRSLDLLLISDRRSPWPHLIKVTMTGRWKGQDDTWGFFFFFFCYIFIQLSSNCLRFLYTLWIFVMRPLGALECTQSIWIPGSSQSLQRFLEGRSFTFCKRKVSVFANTYYPLWPWPNFKVAVVLEN